MQGILTLTASDMRTKFDEEMRRGTDECVVCEAEMEVMSPWFIGRGRGEADAQF